jgi:hypothetical protein
MLSHPEVSDEPEEETEQEASTSTIETTIEEGNKTQVATIFD